MGIAGSQAVARVALGGRPRSTGQLALAVLTGLALLVAYTVTAVYVRLDPLGFVTGIPASVRLLSKMLPPDLGVAHLPGPLLETLGIALWGTTLAVLMSLPVGLLAARNVTPFRLAYIVARGVCNISRAVPELVFALIFVSAVGLGPFAGVLAVAFNNVGVLGKFFAEAVEHVHPGPVEAATAAGAGGLLTVRYAIMPQVLPAFIAFALYRFESNSRHATTLGIVGAGGVGVELLAAMDMYAYDAALTILLAIYAMVSVVDFGCAWIRQRILR